ncbi:hypothetical protein CNQ36_24185 [Streptomyces fungicidicus]|uniref:GmrSD restriction endonucleases N-terminal domain-containing protein n=2 Tax=Streptomyces TaxID=1883 RepID=A0A494UUK5_9ACTN|nr:hypothetical protein CNQ36_24185 [Streptomyces fungicidicus]
MNGLVNGRIRIPAFQRGFVWDADRVAYLMDSLYKGYPYGSLLFWRTKKPLRTERAVGPYEIPVKDPEYPIDYVLDGQQRLTSIFGVFQTSLEPMEAEGWLPIYFDLGAADDAQESQFLALKDDEVDQERHFPLKVLFDTTAYRAQTRPLNEVTAERLDRIQKRFLQVALPLQTFETDDPSQVAIVFERVNRLGTPIDALQLLAAWSWSEDFDLREQFEHLGSELRPFGFDSLSEDPNLLLRCCSAVIAGDASPAALMSLNGASVRKRFQEIRNGIEGAIDFVKTNFHCASIKSLPFSTVLVPLSVFFAAEGSKSVKTTGEQRARLERWFWRTCFARRYSSGVLRNLKTDIEEMFKLRHTPDESKLGDFTCDVTPDFFLENSLNIGTVNTKTFILLLARERPISFVGGQQIALDEVLRDYNRSEYHHIYPREFLKAHPAVNENALVNFAFISSIDNKIISGAAPSIYRERMDAGRFGDICERAMLPDSTWSDDPVAFFNARASLLSDKALEVIS